MPKWAEKGHTAKTREMRELLRDYVLILVNTGMRHQKRHVANANAFAI
jgi:hypothetical protein